MTAKPKPKTKRAEKPKPKPRKKPAATKKPAAKPAKGKARAKVTASGKKVSYGQAGKAKDGGARVKPGTSKGDAYCARSAGIKKGLSAEDAANPNSPNNLSRKRWKCKGKKSTR